VDVNGDGNLDILSGCYSRNEQPMAGLLWVLHGTKDKGFGKPTCLNGSDGKPLILPKGRTENDVIDQICTRPFACDLDGDGKLDLVVGNFRGTFAFFKGEGGGKFSPDATWLNASGGAMVVESHGDPFLVDWDGDGDLDLLSGSASGGVYLFRNEGSRTAPKFGMRTTIVNPAGHDGGGEVRFGDAHCTAPASDTRVWAADVDGDGKLDLLVGDMITLYYVAPGIDEATARTKDEDWRKRQQALMQGYPQNGDAEAMKKWQADYLKLNHERGAFVRQEMTGFVWLFRRK